MTTQRDPILEAVDALAPALASAGLDELELTVGDIHVRLARTRPLPLVPQGEAVPAPPPVTIAPSAAAPGVPANASAFGDPAPGRRHVTAPLTGVWYPAPSPGARPYLNEGDEVTAGQVVGLIEAMASTSAFGTDAAEVLP